MSNLKLFRLKSGEEFIKARILAEIFETFVVFQESLILKTEFNGFLKRTYGFILFVRA